MRTVFLRALIIAAGLGLAPLLSAAEPAPAPEQFTQLPEQTRQLLAPYSERWADLSDDQRRNVLAGLERWQKLSTDEQQAAVARHQRWQELSRDERRAALRLLKHWQGMSESEQQELRIAFERFQSMSKEEQSALRQRYRRYFDNNPDAYTQSKGNRQIANAAEDMRRLQEFRNSRSPIAPGQGGVITASPAPVSAATAKPTGQ